MTGAFVNCKRIGQLMLLSLAAATVALPAPLPVNASAGLPADIEDRIKYGVRAYEDGDNKHAFDAFYRLMADGGRKFGASDGRMARIYTNMGEAYSQQQQYSYAEDCFKRGLNVAEKGYGANSIETVPALIDMAQMYVQEGKFSQAQSLFKRALTIVDKPGDEHLMPYAAVIETDLGSMYFSEGNFGFGEQHFKRAVQLATDSLGANHKWTTTIGGMYAACLRESGKKKEAKAIEQAAVAKANENQSSVFVCNKQMAIADDAMADKRFSDAEDALKLALAAAKELPSEPMLQGVVLTRYGQLLLAQHKPALAAEKLKAAQTIADSTFALDDKSVLQHAKQLADLEKSLDQCREAEPLYTRLLAKAKDEFGPDSPEYLSALADLADLYNHWAQFTKAENAYVKVLSLQEKQLGTDNEKLIPTLVALATATQGNTSHFSEIDAKAEDYYKRAVDIAGKKFGNSSKQVSDILDALSRYYQRHFDWDKATKTCTRVIAADEKTFGPESDETVKALEHYAVVLRAAGLRDEAEPVESRVAKIKASKKPPPEF